MNAGYTGEIIFVHAHNCCDSKSYHSGLAVVRYAIEMYSHQEDIFYGHLCLGGSKWPTLLRCWHFLFALHLSGFGEGSNEKGHGKAPCKECPPVIQKQDVSGRPADNS